MSVLTVTGGQYGSEGKGVIAAHLAFQTDVAIRTGGPNAGHSIKHDGRIWKMRSIPVAWINPRCNLIIGAGAVVDPHVLLREVRDLETAGYQIRDRLFIDQRATIITPADRTAEEIGWGGVQGLGERIGSTLEGVGAARIRRIKRLQDETWITPAEAFKDEHLFVVDTVGMVNAGVRGGAQVMLEGTQGFGLSLTFGDWPFVTSRDCTSAQLIADAGIGANSAAIVRNLTVFRAFPIRVGGNSGPLPGEMTWDAISERVGKPTIEHTTVTGKVRRIGAFDTAMAARAVIINDANIIALTFADYIDPAVTGMTRFASLTRPVRAFVDQLEGLLGVSVAYVGTGGPDWSVVDRTGALGNRWDTGSGKDQHVPLPS